MVIGYCFENINDEEFALFLALSLEMNHLDRIEKDFAQLTQFKSF